MPAIQDGDTPTPDEALQIHVRTYKPFTLMAKLDRTNDMPRPGLTTVPSAEWGVPYGGFQCVFVRKMPDGQFALVAQWARYTIANELTIEEEVQFVGASPTAVLLPYMRGEWVMPPAPWQRGTQDAP